MQTGGRDQINITIALLRGINVGGANKLPMRELVGVLEGLGLREVRTYIQSGNVLFQSDAEELPGIAVRIGDAIEERHGFRPQVLALSLAKLERAIAANPFPEAEAEPKTLHLYFLSSVPPSPDLATLEGIKRESERYSLQGEVLYLHAPEGIGRSKLAARVEKALGVPVTARNWRTAGKIVAMAREFAP